MRWEDFRASTNVEDRRGGGGGIPGGAGGLGIGGVIVLTLIGWALGIDRLAMLIDTPQTKLDAVLAVEDDAALHAAIQALGALRQAGLSADVVATGSPRKRYDKAAKIPSHTLVSVRIENDKPSFNVRGDAPEKVKTVLGVLVA